MEPKESVTGELGLYIAKVNALIMSTPQSHFLAVPVHLHSRLLYSNPVCALITKNAAHGHNAMVISWLTPIDNEGSFMISVNSRRHTLTNLRKNSLFSLSPAVEGQETVLLLLGGSSGADADTSVETTSGKLEDSGVSTSPCALSTLLPLTVDSKKRQRPRVIDAQNAAAAAPPCLTASPARLACRVRSELCCSDGSDGVKGHTLLLCDIVSATVDSRYWDGKRFAPISVPLAATVAVAVGLPRLLSFQGSRTFSAMSPLLPCQESGSSSTSKGAGAIIDELVIDDNDAVLEED